MELSYPLRLLCLIVVCTGLLQTAFEFLLWCCAPLLLRLLRSLTLRQQERALYLIQLVPLALALGVTVFLWAPQYVSHETNFASEDVGWMCLALAAVLSGWWCVRLIGGAIMAVRTMLFSRACRRRGDGIVTDGGATPIIALAGPTPRAGLVGLVRPFIFISKSLLEDGGLDPLALGVVFDHERSHAAQGDNWKLLSLHCLPRLKLRLSSGKTWMQLWQNTAECAADEDAVRGNRGRALLLAETLVRLARLTTVTVPEVACTYFVCQQSELAQRVECLIAGQPRVPAASGYRLGVALGCVLAAVLGVLVNLAMLLHDVPERLLHLG